MPGKKFPHHPMNPGVFAGVSQMLWDFGFRHHSELQTQWVKPTKGTYSNFQCWDIVDVKPLMEEMVVEEFPELAQKLSRVTPENHKEMVKEQTELLREVFQRLQEAQSQVQQTTHYDHGMTE